MMHVCACVCVWVCLCVCVCVCVCKLTRVYMFIFTRSPVSSSRCKSNSILAWENPLKDPSYAETTTETLVFSPESRAGVFPFRAEQCALLSHHPPCCGVRSCCRCECAKLNLRTNSKKEKEKKWQRPSQRIVQQSAWDMPCVHFESFICFTVSSCSSSVTFFPCLSTFLICCNKIINTGKTKRRFRTTTVLTV
jgi:hypothetical protein